MIIPIPDSAPAARARCLRLHATLPATIGSPKRRPTKPESDLTAAWGDPPIRLLCGVPRPSGLGGGAVAPIGVNGVAWLQGDHPSTFSPSGDDGVKEVTFTVVDRGVFVEVDIPKHYTGQSGILIDLSNAVRRALPVQPIPR